MNIEELVSQHRDTLDALYFRRFQSYGQEWLEVMAEFNEYINKHNLSREQISAIRAYEKNTETLYW